ncbi:hypothetical protein [Massilia sp. TSP1-1-2]|uniref:hypothetical protein n=1 Tax=unclassified Massilia TaxID=2609279 RepID=UPI003CF3196F
MDDDIAWDLLCLARKNQITGNKPEALKRYATLMRADPKAFPFFNLFQRTYVLSGLVELARRYAPARAELLHLLEAKRRQLALAPADQYLVDDIATIEQGIRKL